jgi:3-hydroxybutyryl-CoA dehydratase
MEARNRTYQNIALGESAEFEVEITEALVEEFSQVSGDLNPLHMDEEYAATTPFKKRIAHGMLAAALFSRLVGMELPGRSSLYLSQSLRFRKPIYIGTAVRVKGEVSHKSDALRTLTINLELVDTSSDTVLVDGEAIVSCNE